MTFAFPINRACKTNFLLAGAACTTSRSESLISLSHSRSGWLPDPLAVGSGPQSRPVAVRVLPDGPHPHLTLLHEIDHAWYPWILDAEDIAAVMQAIRSAAPPSRGRARSRWDLIKDDDYLSDEHEAWARAYAQYVAWRSGDPRLREQLNGVLTSPVAATRRTAWPWIEFVDIAEAIDKLFVAKGWQEPRTAPTSTTTENP